MEDKFKKTMLFSNEVINKRKLQSLIYLTFNNYGLVKSSMIADRIKNLTFHYATKSGISLSVEDLRVPFKKRKIIGLTTSEVEKTEQRFEIGDITSVERFQKVIDIWNNASNFLKDDIITYFRESDPLNPLYIMAFSGARGNISQVRQLVGMRGLMADPQGQIIDLPIQSNFREGLKVTEYIISSYGARKGLVDTALRTADSGYLTRRLVDVAQDIIVREENCFTKDNLSREELLEYSSSNNISLEDRLIGRLLSKPLVIPDTKTILYDENHEIDTITLEKIKHFNITEIYARSPLTCGSIRSICRYCYGWHLSYSKIVDLGEAVGIIAAQSIGEPGTQLTMRTFHTGGVFSGDLTKQIRAPFSGTASYDSNSNTLLIRTLHGEKGFQVKKNLTLLIEDTVIGTLSSLNIPKNSTLLINNGQKVYENQIIAEIKKDANLILEEDRKDIATEISGETYFKNIKLQTNIDKQGTLSNVSTEPGLLWVLNGERYVFPQSIKLKQSLGKPFKEKTIIAQEQIIAPYSGKVQFNPSNDSELKILFFSTILKNGIITEGDNSTLTIGNSKKFKLQPIAGKRVENGQTIAVLKDNDFIIKTGGTITYDLENFPLNKKKKKTKKLFEGSLYWIPEETYQLTSTNIIKRRNGEFVHPGVNLFSNIHSKLGGFIFINDSNNELIVKPGELFLLKEKDSFNYNRFVKPGESIMPNMITQRLVYLEYISINKSNYLLVRPVKSFTVSKEKGFNIDYIFFPKNSERFIKIKTVKRIFYKNGEKIKSRKSLNLLQTFLNLEIKNTSNSISASVEYVPNLKNNNQTYLKLSLFTSCKLANVMLKDLSFDTVSSQTTCVSNGQFITKGTTLARNNISMKLPGIITAVNVTNTLKEFLIIKEKDIKKVAYDKQVLVQIGELVRIGTLLTASIKSNYCGQIYMVDENYIYIRLGRPYLISEGTIIRMQSGTLVERSDILATLVYDKLKTVDIVQGLPKVEEILEARKIKNECILASNEGQISFRKGKIEILNDLGQVSSILVDPKSKIRYSSGDYVKIAEPLTDGAISPHEKLDVLFNYYKERLPINEACKKSFKCLQLFLVNEVQRTYLSQGVKISDKHIEIIVKQMTSKVKIEESGHTTLLPGEILNLNQADNITHTSSTIGEKPPVYSPILLGLTKASLNSDSFISAASFQETTRVLTEAAIEGKKDWLNGLKENVIIGRLIPAGTGFNCYKNIDSTEKSVSEIDLIYPNQEDLLKKKILDFRTQ
jgi:DNA-directed RNA polymerase subunit beta'